MTRVTFQNVEYDKALMLRLGEVTLKGLNRRTFIDQIMRSLRYRIKNFPGLSVTYAKGRLWIEGSREANFPIADILKAVKPVFGYVSASPLRRFPSNVENLEQEVLDYAHQVLAHQQKASFKFTVKRVDKTFPIQSYDLCVRLGDLLLKEFPDQLSVDVHQPDFEFTVELREKGESYLYHAAFPAYRGLPIGTGGRGLLLLSGGLDSPVAGFKMASRGMRLSAIYFHTYPYTSEEAKQKVIDLAKILAGYSGDLNLHIVDFTPCQLEINQKVKPELLTVIMRRMMFRIAEALANQQKIGALVSGESLGQVASQTLEAIQCIDCLCKIPLLRPLIGTDKDEIIQVAREIGSFETSILPYDDCCTVFVAKHPKTKPTIKECEQAELALDIDYLVDQALSRIEVVNCKLD